MEEAGTWAMGRLKTPYAKIVTIKAKPCTGNAGRPDNPIRQVGGGKLGSLLVPELWDMNLEPRERREHRKTGPGPPGAAWSCSEARAKLVTRPRLKAWTWAMDPLPRKPLHQPYQPRPGLGPPLARQPHLTQHIHRLQSRWLLATM